MGCGCKNKKKLEEAVVVENVEEAVVNEVKASEETLQEDKSNGGVVVSE